MIASFIQPLDVLTTQGVSEIMINEAREEAESRLKELEYESKEKFNCIPSEIVNSLSISDDLETWSAKVETNLEGVVELKFIFNDEIDALMLLAYFVENLISKTKRLKLVEVVFLLKEITNHEMDLRFEAAAANEFAENTKNDVGFHVPKIYWNFTSEEILTLDLSLIHI